MRLTQPGYALGSKRDRPTALIAPSLLLGEVAFQHPSGALADGSSLLLSTALLFECLETQLSPVVVEE